MSVELFDGYAIPEQYRGADGPVEVHPESALWPVGYIFSPSGNLWPAVAPGEPFAHPVLPLR